MKNKVSVIILNWNGSKDTLECLDSLFKSDFLDYEVVLVDNASSDKSVEEFEKIKNKRVRLIFNEKNLGFALGFNKAVKSILNKESKYVMILNSDVIVDKFFLGRLVGLMDKNDDVAIASPVVYDYYNKKELSKMDFPGRFNLKNGGGEPWFKDADEIRKIKNSFKVDYGCGSCWIIRKKIVKDVGFFNEKFFAYAEEIDMAMRLKKSGYNFYINPNSKIWHKVGSASGKILGFRLYYSIRNMIWIERIHATRKEFLFFVLNFCFKKFPKNVYNILTQKNKLVNLFKFTKAIIDGFFKKKEKFCSSKFYMI
ncbi:MAG: glycosyltransferase family 2 protein [archaeon]